MSFAPQVVDDFTGADGSIDARVAAPGGGVWEAPAHTAHTAVPIATNALAFTNASDRSGQYLVKFGPNVRASIKYPTAPNVVGGLFYSQLRASATPIDSADYFFWQGQIVSGASNDTFVLKRRQSAVSTTLTALIGATTFAGDFANNDVIGCDLYEASGGTVGLLYRNGAVTSAYFDTATRPTAPGYASLEGENCAGTADDFSVQTLLVAPPCMTRQGAQPLNVTTGSLTVTLPAHNAGDYLVLALAAWVPNTVGDAAQIPTPTGWTLLGSQVGQPAGTRDGWIGFFGKRATSSAETNPVCAPGASWDTGTDTAFGGRAWTISNVETDDAPWDDVQVTGPHTAANQNLPAVTVSGTDRTVIQFYASMDDQAAGAAPTGYRAGTATTDTTGTDTGFQTFHQINVDASVSAIASAVAAPAQGAYAFCGISFTPPPFLRIAAIGHHNPGLL